MRAGERMRKFGREPTREDTHTSRTKNRSFIHRKVHTWVMPRTWIMLRLTHTRYLKQIRRWNLRINSSRWVTSVNRNDSDETSCYSNLLAFVSLFLCVPASWIQRFSTQIFNDQIHLFLYKRAHTRCVLRPKDKRQKKRNQTKSMNFRTVTATNILSSSCQKLSPRITEHRLTVNRRDKNSHISMQIDNENI